MPGKFSRLLQSIAGVHSISLAFNVLEAWRRPPSEAADFETSITKAALRCAAPSRFSNGTAI